MGDLPHRSRMALGASLRRRLRHAAAQRAAVAAGSALRDQRTLQLLALRLNATGAIAPDLAPGVRTVNSPPGGATFF